MKIVVNDTNIFIDLYECGLLGDFFKLPYTFHTVDLVLNELKNKEQRSAVDIYVNAGILFCKNNSPEELSEIVKYMFEFGESGNLSLTDCSVLFYAKTLGNAKFLTGDRALRQRSEKEGLDVSGILFVFDELVRIGIINETIAAQKLELLKLKNKRLPKTEIEERIKIWRMNEVE